MSKITSGKLGKVLLMTAAMLACTGCKLSPLSPELKQDLQNQGGKIDELKNNQNGILVELGKLKQETEINARDIGAYQQGAFNSTNSGVQILSGNGGLMLALGIGAISAILIYHFRKDAANSKKTAELLAQQIAHFNNVELENKIFMAAMNTPYESHVYHLMVKSQNQAGIRR